MLVLLWTVRVHITPVCVMRWYSQTQCKKCLWSLLSIYHRGISICTCSCWSCVWEKLDYRCTLTPVHLETQTVSPSSSPPQVCLSRVYNAVTQWGHCWDHPDTWVYWRERYSVREESLHCLLLSSLCLTLCLTLSLHQLILQRLVPYTH